MLVYEKVVDGQRKLFGTHRNVPAADDKELVYRKPDGTEITPTSATDKYLDDGHGGIIRVISENANEEMYVFIGTGVAASDNIIPGNKAAEVVLTGITATWAGGAEHGSATVGATLSTVLANLTVKATYSDGSDVTVTDYTTDPAADTTLDAAETVTVTITYEGETTTTTVVVE